MPHEMTEHITRTRVAQLWFSALALAVVIWATFGTTIGVGTAALLIGLSLVPPAMLFMLWPAVQPATVGEVMRGTERV